MEAHEIEPPEHLSWPNLAFLLFIFGGPRYDRLQALSEEVLRKYNRRIAPP